ncbi:uncharacterized protein TNCV_53511 [Trichonephila clavipes]|nr:uncharacterized protein TNCV_53511 [Trichonephila clavipes]
MGDSSPIEAKSIRVDQASEGEPSLPESQRGEEKQEKDKSVEKKKKERGKNHWVPRGRDARTYLKKKHENRIAHECEKHVGSSGAMEPVGVYRIFERSAETRKLQYVHFYGDGDSKSFDAVKNIYGENSVKKFECIGHIQKRVGSRLRKLKLKQKSWEIN